MKCDAGRGAGGGSHGGGGFAGAAGIAGTSTAQLVFIALATATAIFFTTSLFFMDLSPLHVGKGLGPSQFIAQRFNNGGVQPIGDGSSNASDAVVAPELVEPAGAVGGRKKKKKEDVIKTCEWDDDGWSG